MQPIKATEELSADELEGAAGATTSKRSWRRLAAHQSVGDAPAAIQPKAAEIKDELAQTLLIAAAAVPKVAITTTGYVHIPPPPSSRWWTLSQEPD